MRSLLLLAVWLLIPRAVSLLWLAAVRASPRQSNAAGIVTTLVAGVAVWRLLGAVHAPNGATAILLLPIYEMAMLVVLAPISAWLAARRWPFR